MAKNDNNPCKVITGKCRLSYAHIWEPASIDGNSPEKYSACIIIRKDDTATLQKLQRAQDAAVQEGIKSKWKGKRPAKLKLPIRDGDEERPDDEAFKNCWFINANSPGVPAWWTSPGIKFWTRTRFTPAATVGSPSTSIPSPPMATTAWPWV